MVQHCTSEGCHEHIEKTVSGPSGVVDGPDHPYPSYLELRLTARDSEGLTATTSVAIQPKTVDLSFGTQPTGLGIAIGGTLRSTPLTLTVIQGSKNSIAAVTPQDLNGVRYAFQAWADGGTNPRDVIAGSAPVTYTATFTPVSADLAVTQAGTASGSQATFTIQDPEPWAGAGLGGLSSPRRSRRS